MRRITLARHGESVFSVAGLLNGDPSVTGGLTAQGILEAEQLATAIADDPFDLCIHTEFERVRQTAEIALAGRSITTVVEARLNDPRYGRFERADKAWNYVTTSLWWTAFAATWEKGAAWPTIAIGNYIDRKEEFSPWGSCTDNWLHRPAATEDGFAPPLALKPSYCPLSMMFTDWNRSGTPSLRVSNDREYYEGGQEQLWRVERGLPPRLYTEAEGWRYVRIWGMGIASTDLGGEGYPDYFLTSMADNRLQVLAKIGRAHV